MAGNCPVLHYLSPISLSVLHLSLSPSLHRLRLRKKTWRTASTIYLDDQVFERDIHVFANFEIYVEPLKGWYYLIMTSSPLHHHNFPLSRKRKPSVRNWDLKLWHTKNFHFMVVFKILYRGPKPPSKIVHYIILMTSPLHHLHRCGADDITRPDADLPEALASFQLHC